EPVYNMAQGTVVHNTWQNWDAIKGGDAIWWSTRDIPGVCAFTCYVSWEDILAANPNATIVGGVGINQGSGNPGLVNAVDAFTFDDDTYNFEASADTDGDGQGDACDNDDDGDGINDDLDCDPMDKKNDKVLVCHKGQTLCIAKSAVSAHLKHGDVVGPCASVAARSIRPTEGEPAVIDKFNLTSSPNPARGIARIQYAVPMDSRVTIKVYDLMGKEINTLFNGVRNAGMYNIEYNTTKLNSGVYYCRMIATANGKDYVQTLKLVRTE
ncbi:MAG TPA: T9SS type A sorting domain-containing protein, partial [Flavisolibacter sp.]